VVQAGLLKEKEKNVMDRMIAYCGLVCTDCDAFKATQNNDAALRAEVAEKWTKDYTYPFKVDDINCDGCLPDTPKTIGHLNMCAVRKCGTAKGVKNCGLCAEYSCDKTEEFFKMVPDCRKTLDAVREAGR
jgi:hypothetical protein